MGGGAWGHVTGDMTGHLAGQAAPRAPETLLAAGGGAQLPSGEWLVGDWREVLGAWHDEEATAAAAAAIDIGSSSVDPTPAAWPRVLQGWKDDSAAAAAADCPPLPDGAAMQWDVPLPALWPFDGSHTDLVLDEVPGGGAGSPSHPPPPHFSPRGKPLRIPSPRARRAAPSRATASGSGSQPSAARGPPLGSSPFGGVGSLESVCGRHPTGAASEVQGLCVGVRV